MVSFPQTSPPKPCAHLSLPPYVPHVPPISIISILSPAQYWVRSTRSLSSSLCNFLQATNIFILITAEFTYVKKMHHFKFSRQKAQHDSEVHRSLDSCGSWVWNLLHVTILTSRIWWWLLNVCEISEALFMWLYHIHLTQQVVSNMSCVGRTDTYLKEQRLEFNRRSVLFHAEGIRFLIRSLRPLLEKFFNMGHGNFSHASSMLRKLGDCRIEALK